MEQRIVHIDFVCGGHLAAILNGPEVTVLPPWTGIKSSEHFGPLMPKEAKIIAAIYRLREEFLAFKAEVRRGERHFDYQAMTAGYKEPPVKIMSLMCLLHGVLVSRLERFERDLSFAFDGLEIIRAPEQVGGALLLGYHPADMTEDFLGEKVFHLF